MEKLVLSAALGMFCYCSNNVTMGMDPQPQIPLNTNNNNNNNNNNNVIQYNTQQFRLEIIQEKTESKLSDKEKKELLREGTSKTLKMAEKEQDEECCPCCCFHNKEIEGEEKIPKTNEKNNPKGEKKGEELEPIKEDAQEGTNIFDYE
jgi:hypothetical protein